MTVFDKYAALFFGVLAGLLFIESLLLGFSALSMAFVLLNSKHFF